MRRRAARAALREVGRRGEWGGLAGGATNIGTGAQGRETPHWAHDGGSGEYVRWHTIACRDVMWRYAREPSGGPHSSFEVRSREVSKRERRGRPPLRCWSFRAIFMDALSAIASSSSSSSSITAASSCPVNAQQGARCDPLLRLPAPQRVTFTRVSPVYGVPRPNSGPSTKAVLVACAY